DPRLVDLPLLPLQVEQDAAAAVVAAHGLADVDDTTVPQLLPPRVQRDEPSGDLLDDDLHLLLVAPIEIAETRAPETILPQLRRRASPLERKLLLDEVAHLFEQIAAGLPQLTSLPRTALARAHGSGDGGIDRFDAHGAEDPLGEQPALRKEADVLDVHFACGLLHRQCQRRLVTALHHVEQIAGL